MGNVRHLLILFALTVWAGRAGADDRHWIAGLGGLFDEPGSWEEFVVPDANDTAIFDLPSIYTVELPPLAMTDRALVRRGIVMFTGDGAAYELGNELPVTPGLVVGVGEGDVGELVLDGVLVDAVFADIGSAADAFGAVEVTSAGLLRCSQPLRVGQSGVGALTVNEASMLETASCVIGNRGGAYGSVTVSGTSTRWICDGAMIVGGAGAAELEQSGRASGVAGSIIIGRDDGSIGVMTVRDQATKVSVLGNADVGMNGIGTLRIEDGAVVKVDGFMTIGTFPGAGEPGTGGNGAVEIVGPDARLVVGPLGDLFLALAGTGQLLLADGGTLDVLGDLRFRDASGGVQPPLITIVLAREYDGLDEIIAVAGLLRGDEANYRIDVELADGYAPPVGATFRLLSASGRANDIALTLPPLDDGLGWIANRGDDHVTISVAANPCAFTPNAGVDCNRNGTADACDLLLGTSPDCDNNGVPDECDIAAGVLPDCNRNGVPDGCDVASGTSDDCNINDIPDECEAVLPATELPYESLMSFERFGEDVAMHSGWIAVGSPGWLDRGAVFMYRIEDGAPIPAGMIQADDLQDGDDFGTAVSLSSDTLLVGAPGASDGDGAAYVFRFDGAEWEQGETLTDGDGPSSTLFGDDVFVFVNEVAIIGARFEETEGEAFGAGYLYYREPGDDWTFQHRFLVSSDGSSFSSATVGVGDSFAVIGAPNAVTTFEGDGDDWEPRLELRTPTPPDGIIVGDFSRTAFGFDGGRLAVPGSFDGVGTVRVYGGIEEDAVLQPFEGASLFDREVGVSGDTIVFGARADVGPGTGAVFVFRGDGETWRQTDVLASPDTVSDSSFGEAVAIAEDGWVLVGAPGQFSVDGAAFLFQLAEGCACASDVDTSGATGLTDLLTVIVEWGPCLPGAVCAADVDRDGSVGLTDLLAVMAAWGACGG